MPPGHPMGLLHAIDSHSRLDLSRFEVCYENKTPSIRQQCRTQWGKGRHRRRMPRWYLWSKRRRRYYYSNVTGKEITELGKEQLKTSGKSLSAINQNGSSWLRFNFQKVKVTAFSYPLALWTLLMMAHHISHTHDSQNPASKAVALPLLYGPSGLTDQSCSPPAPFSS